MFLAERVELRLGRAELVSGVALDEADLRGEGARDLADGFAQRPEPLNVDVGVADGRHLHRGRVGANAPHAGAQGFADGCRAAALIGEGVQGAARGAGHLDAARRLLRQRAKEREDYLKVEEELPAVVVEAAGAEAVYRGPPCAVQVFRRGAVPGGVAGALEAEEAVCAGVDPEVNRVAALRLPQEVEVVLAVGAVEDGAVGEAHDWAALVVEDEEFAAEVEVEGDVCALPGFGDLPGDVEPAAFEVRAPLLALLDWAVVERESVAPGHWLGRHGDRRLKRDAVQDRFVFQAVEDLADAGFVDVEVEV